MNNFWDQRIPTLLALILLALGIGASTYLVEIGAIPFLHAAPEENPQNVRITNISDTSFTVTYITSNPVLGSLAVVTDSSLNQLVLDDRDQPTGSPAPYKVHSITVRNLKPLTKYLFTITSGRTTYLNRNTPFSISTGPAINAPPPIAVPLAGTLQLNNGNKPTEALIYVASTNGQTLSTLAKSNGLYIIPLNSMRTLDYSSYLQLSDSSKLDVFATDGTLEARASIMAGKRNPVPEMILGNNYDFSNSISPAASSSIPLGFPVFSLDKTLQPEPKIDTPAQNQTFTDPQPMLKGKASPNANVQIIIHSSDTISQTVKADQYGNWTFRPVSPLTPGQHTITVVSTDQNGIQKTLQQVFTIFASGTQVAEAATPSATPTSLPTPTPTSLPTQVPPTPTPTPTIVPSVTVIPTLNPSPTNPIVTSPSPLPKGKVSATGNNSLVIIGGATLVTTVAGIVLFLLSSGISL